MLTLKGVSKWYYHQSKVLDQVELALKPGEFLYVIGGTGAGKTSLLRMIATEEYPSQGEVSLFGQDLAKMRPATLKAVRQRLGYIPQDVRLIPDLTVQENILFSLHLSKLKLSAHEQDIKVTELLKAFGLLSKKKKLCNELSGGERQRVAAARALIREPDLIVADEPTGFQDRNFTWALMELLVKANKRGATVVVATHDREIVRRVRKRCAIIKGGHVMVEDYRCIY